MNKTVIEVQVRAVLPTSGGCAVFIGNDEKVFIIYVDQTVGGAITNFLNAAHAQGFAGKMLSGNKVRHPALVAAFCRPGETLVGWIALGTPTRPLASGHEKAQVDDVLGDWVGQIPNAAANSSGA